MTTCAKTCDAGRRIFALTCIFFLLAARCLGAPQDVIVPRLVNFSGKAVGAQGKTLSGVVGISFAIYKEQEGGSPLWLESQNVQADAKGNYTAQLGATKPAGLPLDLFSSGEARWLGVTVNGGQEQARVLLISVPYALKAADAETLGGLPASAFVRAPMPVGIATESASNLTSRPNTSSVPPPNAAVTGLGTASFLLSGTRPATLSVPQCFNPARAPRPESGLAPVHRLPNRDGCFRRKHHQHLHDGDEVRQPGKI